MFTLPVLLLSALQGAPQVDRPFELMVGDRAPSIQVAEWVQGKPVESFEPGNLYVVEFWATWCGPCKVVIPHMNELSKKYADKVRFVGVSIWETADEPYEVPAFVQEMGDKMTYTVGADETVPQGKGHMAANWMKAAGQGGIPTAFIVNGEGRVAWIGHPSRIDEPLAEVVAGSWDVDKAAKKYALDLRLKGATRELSRKVAKAKKNRDYAGALMIVEKALANEPTLESSFGLEKYFLLLENRRATDAAPYGLHLVASVYADNPTALNSLAWTIVDPQGKHKDGDIALAVKAAERAVLLQEEGDAATLDTLGLALFRSGQVQRAIKVQEKAVRLAKGYKTLERELAERLAEFKKAKQTTGL